MLAIDTTLLEGYGTLAGATHYSAMVRRAFQGRSWENFPSVAARTKCDQEEISIPGLRSDAGLQILCDLDTTTARGATLWHSSGLDSEIFEGVLQHRATEIIGCSRILPAGLFGDRHEFHVSST